MTKPPTLEAIVKVMGEPPERVRPFSNGSEFGDWQHHNCERCQWYNAERPLAESPCGFDVLLVAAYFSTGEIPRVALAMFGVDPENDGHVTNDCRFQTPRDDNEDGPRRKAPDPDPAQLVLIADPTEVIAGITPHAPEVAHA